MQNAGWLIVPLHLSECLALNICQHDTLIERAMSRALANHEDIQKTGGAFNPLNWPFLLYAKAKGWLIRLHIRLAADDLKRRAGEL